MKEKKTIYESGRNILKFISLMFSIVFLGVAVYYLVWSSSSNGEVSLFVSNSSTKVAEQEIQKEKEVIIPQKDNAAELQEEEETYAAEMELLSKYQDYNSDVIGMIRIKDSVLYHPVMRSEEKEDFYLRHDLDKKYNSHGIPFVSWGSDFNKSGNSILYGHNITLKTRDVFCDLAYYEDVEYYKEHPIIEIITPDGVSKYLIFAYYLVDLADTDTFFYSETTQFLSMRSFEEYMNNVEIRNFLDVPCELAFDDCYITLSSCSNQLHGRGTNRMVVMAKKLDENEEYESIVKDSKKSKDILFPAKLR